MNRRVVISGYGVVNALGKNKKEVEESLFNGKCGLSKKSFQFNEEQVTGSVGAVKFESIHTFFEKNNIPYDKCAQLALTAAEECINQSGIQREKTSPYRKGVVVGVSLGGMLSGDKFHVQWLERGIKEADEKLLKIYPLHAMADVIADVYGFKGVKNVISTACAAGGNAIGYGYDMIRSGKYDVMLAGGADPLSRFSFAGFTSLKALDPEFCKPYSTSSGINLGEGAAFFLMEDYEHAVKRNADIIIEVLGYGLSADAYHQTAPDIGGGGAARAIRSAISISGITLSDISYVNGHGTGTTANDVAESCAYRSVFRDYIDMVPLSSIKGSIGHCLGAAGAVECAASIMAIQQDQVPPTVNFSVTEEKQINYVPNKSQNHICNVVLSNSFAFGGNNCCLALSKLQKVNKTRERIESTVVITGIGCVGVGGKNVKELWETFDNRRVCKKNITEFNIDDYSCKVMGDMPEVEWKKYISAKFLRRIDTVTKLTMTSGKQAIDDAKLRITRENMERIGVVYATGSGPMETIEFINRGIINKGIESVNPADFPNSVINAAPGNFCIANTLKGPTSTISTCGTSTLIAVNYAVELLRSGHAEIIIVVGADECNEPMIAGRDKMGLLSAKGSVPMSKEADGMVLSQGSTAFVLETEDHAKARNVKIYAAVRGSAMTSDNYGLSTVSAEGVELKECIVEAMKESGFDHVDYFVSGANGVKEVDQAEIQVINDIFDERTSISNIQSLIGTSTGSAGGYGILGALYSFENGKVISLPDGMYELHEAVKGKINQGENRIADVRTACVDAVAFGGGYASIVLEKYE
ncbi:MAG: beta-ketoacyl-[acyl-carrier-protein] synthase family protein [Hungatella sp.]|jgi:3-oxoacyl-[acyl-carrier-protein] synthase II|nr:beta-ketoacyl-[acyl-carrier-protein] synthase family protein [Hungatella sp.]